MISTQSTRLSSTVMEVRWMNRHIGTGIFLWLQRRAVDGFDPVISKGAVKPGDGEGESDGAAQGAFSICRPRSRRSGEMLAAVPIVAGKG